MKGKVLAVAVSLMSAGVVAPAAGQNAPAQGQEQVGAAARRQGQMRSQFEQLRYQIGTMERVLENAVEHGASIWRDRLQAVVPAQTLLLDNARARGYRLDGYGVFFDVEVPSLSFETTLFSAFRTLDENGLGLQTAFKQVRDHIQAAGDVTLEQALKRIELQVVPAMTAPAAPSPLGARTLSRAAPLALDAAAANAADPILTNPDEVYRIEVRQAVIDAMLDHSGALGIGADEWLTIGARRTELRPRLGLDSNAQTFIIRVRGTDLDAFRAGQLSREDAIKRVEVRVF